MAAPTCLRPERLSPASALVRSLGRWPIRRSPAPEPVDVLGMCDRSRSLAVVASRRPRTALAPRLRTALGLHLHRSLRRPASQQAGRKLPEARGRGTARGGAQVPRGTPCPDVAAERPHGAQGAPARASCRAPGLRGAGSRAERGLGLREPDRRAAGPPGRCPSLQVALRQGRCPSAKAPRPEPFGGDDDARKRARPPDGGRRSRPLSGVADSAL